MNVNTMNLLFSLSRCVQESQGRPERLRMSMCKAQQKGFSLIELMVAVTVGLFLLAGLSTVFVSSNRTRDETARGIEQVENGRYALQLLKNDLQVAGFLDAFDVANASLAVPSTKPNPCATAVASLVAALPMHIQGYDNGTTLSCLSDVKANTDIIVVRHTSTCIAGSSNCSYVTSAPYFQASLFNSASELSSASVSDQYRLDTVVTNLNRHQRDCSTLANMRQYLTNIYFIANNDVVGDGIPTLKRAELGANGFSIVPIAEGIENLQLEYGIDTTSDGIPDVFTANPDIYQSCAGAGCNTYWINTMSVKINILAKSTSKSFGYTDSKTYTLGLDSTGNANTVGPFSDSYKRHVYTTEVRMNNPAGRRQ